MKSSWLLLLLVLVVFSVLLPATQSTTSEDVSSISFINNIKVDIHAMNQIVDIDNVEENVEVLEATLEPSAETTTEPPPPTDAVPTEAPIEAPTEVPTTAPTTAPTAMPTAVPTALPTAIPTAVPTAVPTAIPTAMPTAVPTAVPTAIPTAMPTAVPTAVPTAIPTAMPTAVPTAVPTAIPTAIPTAAPSAIPTVSPSSTPMPTNNPTAKPSPKPTAAPIADPTAEPTDAPSYRPTPRPSFFPTRNPSATPTAAPSFAVGQTAGPTTSAPTLSLLSRWNNYLSSILSSLGSKDGDSIVDRDTFVNLFDLKEKSNEIGTCNEWKDFMGSDLMAGSINYKFAGIEVVDTTVLNTQIASTSNNIVSCNVQTTAYSIANDILAYSVSQSVQSSSYTCQENTWKLSNCALSNNKYQVVLCVNCENPCTASSNTKYRIAPCQSTIADSDGTYRIQSLSVLYQNFPGVPTLTVNTPNTLKDRISGTMQLSGEGTVYVGLFSGDKVPKSIDEIILQNIVAAKGAENSQSYEIRGLVPATDYRLYFAAASPQGIRSTLSSALGTVKAVTTACCRDVNVGVISSTLVNGIDVVNYLTLGLDTAPSAELVVTYEIISLGNSIPATLPDAAIAVDNSPVVPRRFTLGASSSQSSVTRRSNMKSLDPGYYAIRVTLSGNTASSYQVNVKGGFTHTFATNILAFRVLGNDDPLPAPVLSSARFSNDGAYVAINFDRNTNRAGLSSKFNCGQLFNFACASTSVCTWQSASSVFAYVTTDSTCLLPGGNVDVTSSVVLRAQCPKPSGVCFSLTPWPKTNSGSPVTVTAPANPDSPRVVVSVPNQIGACSPVDLDISSSGGNGGRAFANLAITVSSINTVGESQDVTALQTYINSLISNGFSISPPPVLAATYFQAGRSYNFAITLCNFLNACSTASKRMSVLSTILPVVSIAGSNLRTVKRRDALSLTSNAFIPVCGGGSSNNSDSLSYTWSIFVGNSLSTLISTSKDPSRLTLPAFSLTVNTLYRMVVKVTASSGSSASSSVQVFIERGSIVPIIQGSNYRSVRVEETVTIDASGSFDSDVKDLKGLSAGLIYSWSCVQLKPTLRESCASMLTLGATNTERLQLTALASSSNDEISGEVTLTIYDTAQERSASQRITVVVLPSLSPVITLTANLPANRLKLNPTDMLQIKAEVSAPAALTSNITWSVDAESASLLSLADTSLSPVFVRFPGVAGSTAKATYNVFLALPPSTLLPGLTYTFQVGTTLTNPGKTGFASISIEVNSAPLPGQFYLDKKSGEELKDIFTFICNRWVDSDLPLSYSFGYISSSGSPVELRSRSEVSFTNSQLPAGLSAKNYNVTVFAQIFDALNAVSYDEEEVKVTESSVAFSPDDMLQFINQEGSGSVDNVKQKTALASYLLNKVNCTLAPDCETLNRKDCYRTEHTCGPCRSDESIGEDGDANTLCYSIEDLENAADRRQLSAKRSRQLNQVASHKERMTTSVASKLKYQTLTKKLHEVEAQDNKLNVENTVVPNKKCPNDCSGHGTCKFVSTLTMLAPPVDEPLLDACEETDMTCKAVCVCTDNYYGSINCAVTKEELETKRTARATALSKYYRMLTVEDPSAEVIQSWLSTLQEMTQAPLELTQDSVNTLLAVVTLIIQEANDLGLDNGSINAYVNLLNTILFTNDLLNKEVGPGDVRRRMEVSSDTLAQIQTLLDSYMSLAGGNLVPGQQPLASIQSQLRVLISKVASNCANPVSATLPQSSSESYLDVNVGSSSVKSCLADSGASLVYGTASIPAATYQNGLALDNSTQLNSNVIQFYISTKPCKESVCYVDFSLPRFVDTSDMTTNTKKTFTRTCTAEDVDKTFTYNCPTMTTPVRVTCEAAEDVLTITCPSTQYVTTCDAVMDTTVSDVGCTVSAVGEYDITCHCPITDTNNRKLIGGGSISKSFVSAVKKVDTTFAISKIGKVFTTDSEKNYHIIVTVCVLIATTIILLIWASMEDSKAANKISSTTLERTSDILKLANESLPTILQANPNTSSFFMRVVTEITTQHRWSNFITQYNVKLTRTLRILLLWTHIIIVLFIMALVYDGSMQSWMNTCEDETSVSGCDGVHSSFYVAGDDSSTKRLCLWNASQQTCEANQPHENFRIVFLVCLFAALISTPIYAGLRYATLYIFSAPSKESMTLVNGNSNNISNAIVMEENPLKQKALPAGQGAVTTLYEECERDLLTHRLTLDETQRADFDDHWNIDRATGILLEPTTKQLQERIASSIQQLQNENNHVFHNPNVTFYMKMKRLLFLFQANLLQLHVTKSEETYVDILMNKYDRDHVHARPISSIFKILFGLIWLVAVILMIFYILYFGSDIDESTTNYHTSLQKAWLYSVFCYLSFDILLVESVRVVVSDVCIPLMIMSSCVDMKKRLLDVVIQQQHQQHGNLSHTDLMSLVVAAPSNVSPTRSKTGFNLAKYIFSSYQLATQQLQNPGAQMSNEELETGEQRPSDRIIQIILLFQTSLPMLQFTSRKAVEDHKKTGSNCVVAMWNGIVRFFTKLPIGLQDLILTIVTVLVMGYTVFYHIQIYQSKAAFIATPIILIVDFVVVLFVIAYYRQPVLNNDLLTDHKMPSSSGLAKDIAQDIEASSNKAPEPKHQTIAVSQPNEQQL